ncbi:unnamed protein product [Mytilus edulis]|uniref:Mutator-like transposase domain-containing protein n=1 Tax=Mytilus edulis TaxID=6550 RepID=A0A8S3SNJ7_MYTED|nr:unnamed protein product [Mytilus edulis]
MHLSNALGVRPMGVSGMMYIQCTQCGTINKLKLGKTHRPPDSKRTGVGIFNVNTKLAAGMIHSGIGETQLNNLLSTINLHCIDHKSLKGRENEIGHFIEKNAKTSENNFLIEEAIGSLVIGEPSAAGSEDGIKNGLTAITEHMFGNHTFCNVSWCGGLTKGEAYKHLNLPYGKDLTSKQLKADLEKIFQNKLLTKANQLSKLSSSQANESFNNTVASKAPKRLHYSGSASLGYRV